MIVSFYYVWNSIRILKVCLIRQWNSLRIPVEIPIGKAANEKFTIWYLMKYDIKEKYLSIACEIFLIHLPSYIISYLGLKLTTKFGILSWVLKIWHFFMTWMLVGGIYFGLRHLVTQTILSRVNYPMVTSLANLEQDHLLELNKPEKWNTWNLPIFFFLKIDSTFI